MPVETVDILAELREDSQRIGEATTALYSATVKLDGGFDDQTGEIVTGVRTRWQEAYDEALIELEERYLAEDRRLPAADIRTARVTRQIREHQPELYAEYLALTSRVKLLQTTIQNRKAAVSARQSVLRGERE